MQNFPFVNRILTLPPLLTRFFFFQKTEPLQPTEVWFPSGSQKARYKERKCHPRNEHLTLWGGRTTSHTSSQSPQTVTFQTADVHSWGMFDISITRISVIVLVVNWLHVSLQAAPLVLRPFCNMRPWNWGFSLKTMKKRQKKSYRCGPMIQTAGSRLRCCQTVAQYPA